MSETSDDSAGVLFARQPIYDRKLALAGYELLFRPYGGGPIVAADFDGNRATSQVLINAFTAADIREVCDNQPAYVNFTADSLIRDIPFDSRALIIEILEDVTDTPEVIEALVRLREEGHVMALDDYTLTDASHPLLPFVDVVKLDYPFYTAETLADTIQSLLARYPDLQLLAEKIETQEDYRIAMDAGCTLFQGYFLARPEPVYGRVMPINRLNILRLLAELNAADISMRDMAEIVQRDPFLSVRLLRMANAAFAQQSRPVTSLHGAVMALGLSRIRSLASLLVLSRFDDKPHALQQLAMMLGHFCHQLASQLPGQTSEMGFTVGLFSCLDSFMDQPLEEILAQIPVHPEIEAALMRRTGPLGLILQTAIDYQRAQWERIDWPHLAELGLSPDQVAGAYQQALMRANRDK
ncbi:EAL and HDOD domain-containing protein [Kushneria indalinina]|uniref:Diguanylate phosphodiesterase n=1 Tax=Kushneria indalinina DSM 14324 TaxID=1122140 RepID=A0A3D9DV39_9GAMM|nr:HDOD domain-containing protein [Kushneria indalinina]REC94607.1 diguanylate phosphodiesterase [Kushneria indalinina DSM 14324]